MFATREGERLYLRSWDYNVLRIMTRVRELVRHQGGFVKPAKTAVITNSGVANARRKYQELLSILETRQAESPNEHRARDIAETRAELAALPDTDTRTIEVVGASWIRFVLRGRMYYIGIADNPLFDHVYTKARIDNAGKYIPDTYSEKLSSDWVTDEVLKFHFTDDDVDKAARRLLGIVIGAPDSRVPARHHTTTAEYWNWR